MPNIYLKNIQVNNKIKIKSDRHYLCFWVTPGHVKGISLVLQGGGAVLSMLGRRHSAED